MKKSEIYIKAQIAVVAYQGMSVTDKLQILRELMDAEDLASFCEEQEAEELLKAGGDDEAV